MDLLYVELFGWLRARVGEHTVTRFQTRQTAALLAYLARHRRHPHPRDMLVELLWPEGDPERGRHSLSQALSSLRRAMEPAGVPAGTFLLADRAAVQLHPERCTTDVDRFEELLREAKRLEEEPEARRERLVTALELYRGELLPGFCEDWCLSERERLAERYLQVLQWVAADMERGGELEGALDYARRAVVADPLRESAHRDVIRLCGALGRREAALRQFRELERILRDELDATPSRETRALLEELDAPRQPPATVAVRETQFRPQAAASSLPSPLTRFYGRESELTRLAELLRSGGEAAGRCPVRLVTLTGAGGTGKTRLALETAARLERASGVRAHFVPMAALRDAHLIPQEILKALGVAAGPGEDVLRRAVRELSQGRRLLVLDNLEQLVEGAAPFVKALLEGAPELAVLTTSRRRLSLPGETELVVPPLPVPSHRAGEEDGAQAAPVASVELFVDRAGAARLGFGMTAANREAVEELCRRLEGIPLALELAAARVTVMSPGQILARLDSSLDFLTGRAHAREDRHRSLRAAVDWSYGLLAPDLRRVFSRLSVFRGGWTLEAAEAVAGAAVRDGDADPERIEDALEQLRESSMVLSEEEAEGMRFRMLEPLREYAAERLPEAERETASEAHARFYLSLAETAAPRLTGPEQGEWVRRLEGEGENLRAALEWSAGKAGEPGRLALRLATALWRYWSARGLVGEGRRRLALALKGTEADPPDRERAAALFCAGALAHSSGDMGEAVRLHEQALALRRELGDDEGTAASLDNLAIAAQIQGDSGRARALHEEAIGIWRRIGHRRGLAGSLSNLALVAQHAGDYEEACALHEECLAIRREVGDLWGVAASLHNLACAAQDRGELDRAVPMFEEAHALFLEVGHRGTATYGLLNLGVIARLQGDLERSRRLLRECLAIRRELEDRWGIAFVLEAWAGLARQEGKPQEAVRFWAASDALRTVLNTPPTEVDRESRDRALEELREELGGPVFNAAWETGRHWTPDQAADRVIGS